MTTPSGITGPQDLAETVRKAVDPERRAKQAQAIHAWQPWKRATGPRSNEGKAKASRNAYAGAMRLQLRELGRALREIDTSFRPPPRVTGPSLQVGTRGETSAENC